MNDRFVLASVSMMQVEISIKSHIVELRVYYMIHRVIWILHIYLKKPLLQEILMIRYIIYNTYFKYSASL